jgi:hypothetical protein
MDISENCNERNQVQIGLIVGHLLRLGHVGSGTHTDVHNDNSAAARGVTKTQIQDVMGKGSTRRPWHALRRQQSAEASTGIPAREWLTRSLYPTTLHAAPRLPHR